MNKTQKPFCPPEYQRLLTIRGFNMAFDEEIRRPDIKSYEEAFERVNRRFIDFFGMVKYSNYQSFRRVRARLIQKGHCHIDSVDITT